MTNIGVFDSGLGGLSVLNKLVKSHKANYFYLGDNKRVPYGSKSKEEIIRYSNEIVKFLEKFKIDFYVVACNTISVNSLDFLRENFGKKFISITEMGIKSALEEEGDAYLLATKATVETHVYKKKIEEKSDKIVTEVKAPLLVDLIENGQISGIDIDKAIIEYLKIANKEKIKNIILGCTHYPIIEKQIEKNLTYDANIIDPAIYLCENLNFKENEKTEVKVFMTDVNPITQKMTNRIMGKDVNIIKAIL